MEQRLRLVQGSGARSEGRKSERRPLALPAQIVWKDAKGATRMAPVVTRDVSDLGVAVESSVASAIPLYRLVYFQIDRHARNSPELPAVLRKSNVLSAIFRVGECSAVTGAPTEYALRLLVEPEERRPHVVVTPRAGWSDQADSKTA
jgi:hypothetical protein